MANERALLAQVGLQTEFGTGVTPTIKAPWKVDYEDGQEQRESEYDGGTWLPTTKITKLSDFASLKTSGDMDFEMLAVLLNSGLADVAPTGTDPYTHTYLMDPAAPGTPKPLTYLVGATGENIGGTGPAVKLIDQYMQKLTLSGSINDKVVGHEAEWFGTAVNDNSGAGFAFEAGLTPPANCEGLNALLGQLNLQDAATTGGDFTTMTAFACALIGWKLTIDTGLQPKWCLCDNKTTFSATRVDNPAVELEATIRTSATNYALVRGKHLSRTFQELQLIVNGSLTRKATFNLTGWWQECKSAHVRENGDVVMKAKFAARVPYNQGTTPHFFGATVISKHGWT